jgi:transposase InsO family protein
MDRRLSMSWKVSDPMSERVKFIGLLKSGQRTVAGLCQEFGISRKTAYKWAERFELGGLPGLEERSRARHQQAHQTSVEIQELLIAARKQHPTWGPRKLKAWLENGDESLDLPASSTIGDLLKREGLVAKRRRRIHPPASTAPNPREIRDPNQEWDADFKGEFKLGNGEYCYPLTVTDAYSRYLFEVRALKGTGGAKARPYFEKAFREYGLPMTIRTDNGSPFASAGLGRLSALSVWWIRLGIRPVRGRPHHPQDNGRHERMHRTLKAETTRPPAAESHGQQRRFDAFRREYNQERPHEALGQRPPAGLYRPSARIYPERLPEVEYPCHYETRKVTSGGMFTWRTQQVFIGHPLIGERVGLVEIEDGLWRVSFGDVELGVLDEVQLRGRKTGRVLPMCPV